MTHLIAQSRQRRDEPAYTICDCGHRAEGATPEESAAAFAAHRREMRATHSEGFAVAGRHRPLQRHTERG